MFFFLDFLCIHKKLLFNIIEESYNILLEVCKKEKIEYSKKFFPSEDPVGIYRYHPFFDQGDREIVLNRTYLETLSKIDKEFSSLSTLLHELGHHFSIRGKILKSDRSEETADSMRKFIIKQYFPFYFPIILKIEILSGDEKYFKKSDQIFDEFFGYNTFKGRMKLLYYYFKEIRKKKV